MAGRYAPSPTGALHLGNLRTALLAWLTARSRAARFVLRFEDLDRNAAAAEHEACQLAELAALGLDWEGNVWRQSDRFAIYRDAIEDLAQRGLTYECYCSRREIREAANAPHGANYTYPGTCRTLTASERQTRRRLRPAAVRFRAPSGELAFTDLLAGPQRGEATDVVLCRNDGVPAYNLAVVVDDAAVRVDHVVRGDDLLTSTPAQIALQRALGFPQPDYVHVPLVVGPTGQRLAKRDGAVTLAELAVRGVGIDRVRGALAASLGLAEPGRPISAGDVTGLVDGFDLGVVATLGSDPVDVAAISI